MPKDFLQLKSTPRSHDKIRKATRFSKEGENTELFFIPPSSKKGKFNPQWEVKHVGLTIINNSNNQSINKNKNKMLTGM